MIPALKIFSAAQIRQADQFTIRHKPISSENLMERAAQQCTEWIERHFSKKINCIIFCGPGNNGGDGLAITRLLIESGYNITTCCIASDKYSADHTANKEKLNTAVELINTATDIPSIQKEDLVIDAIFGTGLSKAITGIAADCITAINNSPATVISIDLPSGLFADAHSDASSSIIKAKHTLSFQFPKLAFFFPENENYVGEWHILDIGLSKEFIETEQTSTYILTEQLAKSILKPRKKFSHKGTFGHALLIAGSYEKMGAAILSSKACLRSGTGLVTVHIPACGYEIIQSVNPEAMASIDAGEKYITNKIETQKFSTVGIGPGIGTEEQTQQSLHHLLVTANKPLVIDADALNILSLNKKWIDQVPENSILTPHPKEFERIAGKAKDDFEKHELQVSFSKKYKLFVILKGANTCITMPSGDCYFNVSGNPGMAKGGTGDILTGIITGILAQGYSSFETCLLSVFIHGLAGDLAKEKLTETAMNAGDLCDFLPVAFMRLHSPAN